MFHIVLFEPQIAPNTGNIIRLVANNGCFLHLIEPLGFDLEEKKLRRAGLDYHDMARVKRHKNFAAFSQALFNSEEYAVSGQLYAITTKGTQHYTDVEYQKGDILLFGSETSGLPPMLMDSIAPENRLLIPMQPNSRSLNLSNSVAIVSYEAWRQHGFASPE
ncbi:MAG TPA: tRNA (uridine(34)/cytosine(34)/5-carboxymethylaminomethyluridine(34)-2'-O)-methyltransferase TrmL [Gammaproteobacteria bacterium]|nr:tRNA (uridine(34)/cytosine(34)/5-carboxymethylaminomethyluridine(34)-2'-O)-methyltransferase TrmL [Gammaproteobacteria bacterium]HCK93373.1 tRNA (uridine(34)/cytosine(34)/5-carboxymethylaminomethyluridine(34)-2'-O)-methyltransferase TrmL [Gammaproteobacteria bacterium]|tara:strand:+ start:168 stop:653 length:486 start_codon:yes stop_codon:yes gene_type:complete